VLLWPVFLTYVALMQELSRFAIVPAIGAAVVTLSMMRGAQLNFQKFDDPTEPYVYVQTFREIRRFTDPLLERARYDPAACQFNGQLLLGSYYPLPWMLGDFTNVAYFRDENWPPRLDGDFIAAEKSKAARVEKMLSAPYFRREFRLRDAQEDCYAWFRVSTFREQLDGEPIVGPAAPRP